MTFERYRDQIKFQLPSTRADKPFSEATVHRAIRKLSLEGIVGIVPSKDKAESNTIRFYGLPQDTELIGELVDLVEQLNQHIQRFQSVMNRKNREIERIKRDNEHLHHEVNELLEGYEELSETQNALDNLFQEASRNNNQFPKGRVVSAEELPGGLIALIIQI